MLFRTLQFLWMFILARITFAKHKFTATLDTWKNPSGYAILGFVQKSGIPAYLRNVEVLC